MNVHPQFFDINKALILKSRLLRDHAGLGCQGTGALSGAFTTEAHGDRHITMRAELQGENCGRKTVVHDAQ